MASGIDHPATVSLDDFNLLDTQTFSSGHPWAEYDRMRAMGRLVRHPGMEDVPDFWVATHYEDIHHISHNPRLFSTSAGFNMPVGGRRADPAIMRAMGRNIISYEPDEHAEFKQLLMPAFSAANLKILEARSKAFVSDLLDRLSDRTDVEFVSEIAAIVPIRVLCVLLGIPLEDEALIFSWTNKMVGASDPDYSPDPMVALKAFMDVFAYGKALVERKREQPDDDLMSKVAAGRLSGEWLDDATRDGLCATLVAAGNETTRNAITGAIVLLSQNTAQRDRLASDPHLMTNAIEEILRRITPAIHMCRTATEDTEVGGQRIAAAETIVMLYGAANHDPAIFEDPYAFDIDRPNTRKHLAFGTGIHLCIGQRLAQIEMRVLLGELLIRYPNIHAVDAPTYLKSNFVSGIKHLRVSLA